jgi:hypothetical protein
MVLSLTFRADIRPPAVRGKAITVDGAIVDTDLIGKLLGASRRTTRQTRPPGVPDAARLGRRMAALYACWQHGALPDLEALADDLLRRNAIPPDGPLARTCRGAARAVAAWGGLPYHSAGHHAEVATNAMVLVALAERMGQEIDQRGRGILLAACLAHDLHYLPSLACHRFAAEAEAAEALDAIAAASGCSAEDRHGIRALVIATEPGLRLRSGGPLGTPLDPMAAQLIGAASVDPALAGLAAILSDADLLSSVGLTVSWYRVQQTRLERETGQKQSPQVSCRFFRDIVGPDFLSQPGRLFAANLAAIRRTIAPAVC